MAEIVVNLVVDQIMPFLVGEVQLLQGVREEMEKLVDELNIIKVSLRAADAMEETDPETAAWLKQVRDVAYDIEDALAEYQLHLSHGHGNDFLNFFSMDTLRARHKIASDFQRIKSRFVSISEGHQRYHWRSKVSKSNAGMSCDDRRGDALLLEEAEVVGIDKPKKELTDWLIRNNSEQQVLAVHGMGGLGKTTLAKKVYDGVEVRLHFDCRVWITVSKSYKMDKLLKHMLRRLHSAVKKPLPQGLNNRTNDEMRTMIKKLLKNRMYLVALDDVWDIELWNFVKLALPNDGMGSRVMLTTRNKEVADASCKEFHGKEYPLKALSEEEAWTLFCRKTFEAGECPSHLETISKQILKRCEGLPLAIVAVSGVLAAKDPDNLEEWNLVYSSMNAALEESHQLRSMKNILSLSYYDLPYYLKPCFLYLSVFPHYHLIDQMKLIRLWIAEGFVKETEGRTKEEVAEGYLRELLDRSLIQVAETTSDGRLKTFRVHDLVHEIIISKSKDQNFVTVAREQNVNCPPKVRRLSIHINSLPNLSQKEAVSTLRSLFHFWGSGSTTGSSQFEVFPLQGCKLLNVLHLQGAPIDSLPNEIFNQHHLKYLSLKETEVKTIPSSIKNLQMLETLNLKHTQVSELPVEILQLKKLRHLLVYRYEVEEFAKIRSKIGLKALKKVGQLQCLQKLAFLEVNDNKEAIEELGKLTQLRRLGILKLAKEDGITLCSSLEKLTNLRALSITSVHEKENLNLSSLSSPPPFLHRLYLTGHLEKLPHWISSATTLEKIFLKRSKLKEDPLQVLQNLPNLIHLELQKACSEEKLCFKAQGFQKLKVLGLDKFGKLSSVILEEGTMPHLEKLMVLRCKLMQRLPSGIERLQKLRVVELYDMNDELFHNLQTDREREDGEYTKVAHVPEVYYAKYRDNGWDVYHLHRLLNGEGPLSTRSTDPPIWKSR